MHTKTKIFISLFFILIFCACSQISFAKYVIEDINLVAKLDIDRCKPEIELISIHSSNTNYESYANKNHIITVRIKITEKNIVINQFSQNNIKISVGGYLITPNYESFSLISENSSEKIYEFSFSNTIGDGNLQIEIPGSIIEDKSGLKNDTKTFKTGILIDNTPPVATFQETSSSNNKSIGIITSNENIRPLSGWDTSTESNVISKEFTNYISYDLPITDLAQNTTKVLVDIKNATNILLSYGTYDDYNKLKIVSSGKISAPNTIFSNSICKSEALFMRLEGDIESTFLQGRAYLYTHWGEGSTGICRYSEIPYCYGYNPFSSEWIDLSSRNTMMYHGAIFAQLGGIGLNIANATDTKKRNPIPSDIAKQYLYGISGIQFRLKDTSHFSIVYQAYIKDVGWLETVSDEQECLYQHTQPISAFRMNIVPKSDKQYLIDFWNRDIGTNHID